MSSATWSQKQVIASMELIRRGSYRHLLHSAQQQVYDYVTTTPDPKNIGIYSTRKLGKSYFIGIMCIFYGNKKSNMIIRYVAPTVKNAKEIMYPIMTEISRLIPPELMPVLKRSEAKYLFPNGSELILCSADPASEDSARGPRCDIFFFDESSFYNAESYNYFMKSVYLPQQTLVENPLRFYITTPPRITNHPFLTETKPYIERTGKFFKFTIYDNPLLNDKMLQEAIDMCGGEHTNEFKREYLAQEVSDETLIVIPEFSRDRHVIDEAPDRVDLFGSTCSYVGYIACDFGYGRDWTGIVVGYLDHNRSKLVLTNELIFKDKVTMETFVKAWNNCIKEHLYFTQDIEATIDTFPGISYELRTSYNLDFRQPLKGKLEDNIAFLRNCFINDKIEIVKSCTMLISQLEKGTWDKHHRDLQRSSELSHLDLLAASMYMVRMVDWTRFPGVDRVNIKLGKESDNAKNILPSKAPEHYERYNTLISNNTTEKIIKNRR